MAVKHALHAGRRHRASLHWSIRGQTRARGGAAVKRREESDGGDAGQHRLARAHQRNSPPNPVESILAHLALQTKADDRGPAVEALYWLAERVALNRRLTMTILSTFNVLLATPVYTASGTEQA